MKCWYDDNIDCLSDCELVGDCQDRMRMLDMRTDIINEITEKYFDAISDVLREKDLKLELNQALTIYARIMNACDKILKESKNG